jgi:hypothetical protein
MSGRIPNWHPRGRELFVVALVALAALPATALATHPRPGSASPHRLALVPAYAQCTAPDATHNLPAQGSCTNADVDSSRITIGSTGNGSGFMRFQVYCTNAEQPPCPSAGDDALDVKIDAFQSDVRCRVAATGCATGNVDYTGTLGLAGEVRLTDHSSNGLCTNTSGAAPCVVATSVNFEQTFGSSASCVPSGSLTTPPGSSCTIATTLDAQCACVFEQQRAIWDTEDLFLTDAQGQPVVSDGFFTP